MDQAIKKQVKTMKPSICIWDDLSLEDVTHISNCESPEELKLFIKKTFQLDPKGDKKDRIMLDLYYYTLAFTKEKQFTKEQTSSFFSIVKKTHEKAIETPFGNTEETFSFFKDTLSCHTVKRPPFCIELFNLKETSEITDYVLNTYFRHFKLYKYVFTPKVVMNLTLNYNGLKEEPKPEVEQENEEEEENTTELEEDDYEVKDGDQQPDDLVESKGSEEDSPAVKDLKKLIRTTVDEQISKLKTSVEQKLKANEEMVMKKVNGSQSTTDGIATKTSRKGKKK